MKISPKVAGTPPIISIDNTKVINSSSGNDKKLTKSDFTKPVYKAEKPSFLTPNIRQTFIQLRQAFTEASIVQHFDSEQHI